MTETTAERNDRKREERKAARRAVSFVAVTVFLLVALFISLNTGTLKVGMTELFKGLFIKYDADVSSIFDLRFPRIVIAVLAGAGISVSGVLFQAVLKNPLADPGIIGISSGAGFVSVVITAFAPSLLFLTPLFAFAGGIGAYFLVYTLSWKGGLSPLRIILVGVAVNSMFTGLSAAFNSMNGGNVQGVAAIVNGNIAMKTWEDVRVLFPYVLAGLLISVLLSSKCNILSLEDKTIRNLGMNVNQMRTLVSAVGVLLASISAAIVGNIVFLGLIVPHISRLLVGSNHKRLMPFSMILGALIFLIADTLGRTVAPPYEISPAIIMSVIGGPFFIVLLRRSKQYGK